MKENYWNFNHIKNKYPYEEREFAIGQYKIFSWSLSPGKYEKTVILLHGFLDHSLTNLLSINWFLEHSFRVIAADMPGHGHSSGVRGGLDSFDTYHDYFSGILNTWSIDLKQTYALGHSTGASILIDYCRKNSASLRGVIFAAPLIKIGNHAFVVKGFDIAQTKITEVPIKKSKSSRNKSFLKYKWNDPLGVKRFSLSWVRAMVEWNEKWRDFSSDIPLLILQGSKDSTVEWKKNLPILEKCFNQTKTILIRRARHHILNENDKIRKTVFAEIEKFLDLHD